MKHRTSIFYLIAVLAVVMIPSVGMIFAKSEWSAETTALAEAPGLVKENGQVNKEFLSDAGNLPERHSLSVDGAHPTNSAS